MKLSAEQGLLATFFFLPGKVRCMPLLFFFRPQRVGVEWDSHGSPQCRGCPPKAGTLAWQESLHVEAVGMLENTHCGMSATVWSLLSRVTNAFLPSLPARI